MKDIEELLPALRREAERIHKTAEAVNERTVRQPARKLLQGRPLTEQEYYLVRTGGVHLNTAHQLGFSPVDEYRLYRHLCYEDDRRICCINPEPKQTNVDDNAVTIQLGCTPEELHTQHLRPDQKAFFQEHLPELLARFQDN